MTPPLALRHLKPETIEKSDLSRILNIFPRVRPLGARDNRKVGLVTHNIDTAYYDQSFEYLFIDTGVKKMK